MTGNSSRRLRVQKAKIELNYNKILLMAIVLMPLAVSASAAPIYVDNTTTACSSNPSSNYDPKTDTCGNGSHTVYKTFQSAADIANPGDIIIVKDGIYNEGKDYVVKINRAGTSESWITFKAENKWGAVIDGGSSREGIHLGKGAKYIRIEDFEIKNVTTAIISNYISSPSYVYIYGNHIHNAATTGIYLAYVSNYFTIDSNIIHDVYTAGDSLYHGIYLSRNPSNTTIINNIIYNIPNGWPIHLYYKDAGSVQSNTKIINNTFADTNPNKDGHILVAAPSPNLRIENNIFYNPKTAAIQAYVSNSGQGVVVRNNLTNAGTICIGSYCSGYTFSDNLTGTNPSFDKSSSRDYHLQQTSQAKDTGLNTNAPALDFDGDSRPQGAAVDIGADEYKR